MMRDVPGRTNRGPALVVGAAIVTMAVGFVLKSPCLGSWADGRQYNLLCYSDVAALYASDDRDRGRDGAAGILLGLGAATKLYPALLVIPFALGRWRQGRPGDARRLIGVAALTWAGVNLPFAVFGFDRWAEFFRFNSSRGADWDSLWFIAARPFGFTWDVTLLNVLTATAFEVADVAVFVTRFQFFARLSDQGPGLPFWSFEVAVVVRAAILIACVVAWMRAQAREPAPEPVLEAA